MVLHGDTAIVQYGIGTFGSRGTAVGGTALYYALQELKAKIKKFGAMLLESDDVTLAGGACVDEQTGKSVSLARDRRRGLSRHEAAAQHRARPGGHALLGAAQFHLPVRRAHRGDGGGSRNRRRSRSAATWRWTIAARSSIRCWWTARCTAAWRRASARRSGSRRSTTTTASSSPAS